LFGVSLPPANVKKMPTHFKLLLDMVEYQFGQESQLMETKLNANTVVIMMHCVEMFHVIVSISEQH
jgi:hypothetical protein